MTRIPNMRKRLPLIAAALLGTVALQAAAGPREDVEVVRQLRAQGEIVSLESILPKAQRIQPGQMIDAYLERKNQRYVYEVEILDPEGRVWEVKFDAKSGQFLKLEEEDH